MDRSSNRFNAFKQMKGDLAYGMSATNYKSQTSMSIVKDNKFKNTSRWGQNKQKQSQKPVPKLSLEADFPTLGGITTKNPVKQIIDYKTMTQINTKKRISQVLEDEITPGWVIIKKENNKIKYFWGKPSEKQNQVDNFEKYKLITRFFENLETRINDYKIWDFQGIEYINSWDYDEYISRQQWEQKLDLEYSNILSDGEGDSENDAYESYIYND